MKVSKLKYLLCFTGSLTAISLNTLAGQSLNSEVTQVEQRDDGVVKIQVNHGSHNNLPACSFSGGTFLFDGSVAAGKNMLSMALSALISDKKVNIESNTCYAFSNNADTQLGKVEKIILIK